jgi:HAD superfamily hydrolase (TIGR01509 family)
MSTTETAQYFIDRFNLSDPIDTIKNEWIDMAFDYYATKIPLKAGALGFIKNLTENGVKIGVGTSNFRHLTETVLKAHGIDGFIDTIRTSCEVARGKPSPDVFLKVAEDLGVDPTRCLVFEDTHAGVLAAKNAGMDVIAVSDPLSIPYKEQIMEDAMQMIDNFCDISF